MNFSIHTLDGENFTLFVSGRYQWHLRGSSVTLIATFVSSTGIQFYSNGGYDTYLVADNFGAKVDYKDLPREEQATIKAMFSHIL